MPELVGPDGVTPLRKADLVREIAGPTLTGVRSILGGHPAQGLTPQRLAAILRQAEMGDATSYLELAEEMEEKLPRYMSTLGTRKRQVSQLEITVEPASDAAEDEANAELVREFLKRKQLETELFDVQDAVGKGYSVTEIVWDLSERQYMPRALKWRLPQWFEFDRLDGETLRLRGDGGQPEPLAPYKFIVHTTQAKSGLPIRGGLARAVSWWYLFQNYSVKDWVTFIEVYGQPLRVGKYHAGATPEDKRILLRALSSIGTDAAAMIPEGMIIEFIKSSEGARANADLYNAFVSYVDNLITLMVLGQNLTTQVEGGSYAAANVHDCVREDIERADCKQLEATLDRDLVRPIVFLNRGEPAKGYPSLKIGRPEQADVAALSDALAKLVPLGLRVGQAEVRRKIALEDPADDAELLAAPAPPPNPFDPLAPLPGETEAQAAARAAGIPALHMPPHTIDAIRRSTAATGRLGAGGRADRLQMDAEADRLAQGWERVLGSRVRDLLAAAEASPDVETFRARLGEVAAAEPDGELLAALEQAGFVGRLWGYWRKREEEP